MKRRYRHESGTTMVEFALVCTFLLVLIFGIIDFGRALYTYHFLSNAARTGSRWAAVNGGACNSDGSCNGTAPMNNGPASQSDVQTYVRGLATGGIDSSSITVTACGVTSGAGKCSDSPPGCTLNEPGCMVQVTVSYNFSFLVPLVRSAAIPMSSTSEMVIAH
jgi:Flp pilus assembly protein TadG